MTWALPSGCTVSSSVSNVDKPCLSIPGRGVRLSGVRAPPLETIFGRPALGEHAPMTPLSPRVATGTRALILLETAAAYQGWSAALRKHSGEAPQQGAVGPRHSTGLPVDTTVNSGLVLPQEGVYCRSRCVDTSHTPHHIGGSPLHETWNWEECCHVVSGN